MKTYFSEAAAAAVDLAGEGALAVLGLLERFFLRREFLLEGRFAAPGVAAVRLVAPSW